MIAVLVVVRAFPGHFLRNGIKLTHGLQTLSNSLSINLVDCNGGIVVWALFIVKTMMNNDARQFRCFGGKGIIHKIVVSVLVLSILLIFKGSRKVPSADETCVCLLYTSPSPRD